MPLMRILGVLLSVVVLLTPEGQCISQIGCFADVATDRDLNAHTPTLTTLSSVQCATACRTNGYPYAALQAGTDCRCDMTYGKHGTDNGCTQMCGLDQCGGTLANNVYYAVESARSARVITPVDTVRTFENARKECVKANGDLYSPETEATKNSLAADVNAEITNANFVWLGLWRLDGATNNFMYAEAGLGAYDHTSKASWWGTIDTSLCVAYDVANTRLVTKVCTTPLPYVCHQPSTSATTTPAPTEASGDFFSSKTNVTMYLVLPLFLVCFGGSCLIYGCAKMYRACKRRNKKKMMILQNENFDNMENARESNGPGSRAVTPLPRGAVTPLPQGAVTPTRRRPVTPMTSRSVIGGEESTPRSPSQISARPVTPATNHRGIPPPYTPTGSASANRLTVESARAVSRQQVAPLVTAAVVSETNQKPTYNEIEKAKFLAKAEEMRSDGQKKALLQNALKEARGRREKEQSNLSAKDISTNVNKSEQSGNTDPRGGSRAGKRAEKHPQDPRPNGPGPRGGGPQDPSGRRSRAEEYARLIPPELQFEPANNMEGAESNIKAIEEIVRAKRILMRQKRKKERVKQHQILSADQD